MNISPSDSTRLRRWQGITVTTLFVGYAGYYICRSVLPVVSNQLIDDTSLQFDERDYGRLGAIGIYFYAIGKLLNGIFTEYVGGRIAFLAGMLLSAVCVVFFGLADGFALFALFWAANRFVQSAGWVALVKITSRWFHYKSLATVMGVLSLSYLFGDALARLYLGMIVWLGFSWREVFFIAAGTLTAIAFGGMIFLKQSPKDIGHQEPPPPPRNVHGDAPADTRMSLRVLLGPLLRSKMFWLVCAMNAGFTAIRETFNFWTPRYLKQDVGLSSEDAALLSFLFPLCGAVASLAAGYGADRLRGRFGRLIVPLTALAAIALGLIAGADLRGRPILSLTLVGCVALFLMGPYTYCAGVLAMNLGGKRASAASTGIVDAVGYTFGAIISGEVSGYLVKKFGFTPLFWVLFWIGILSLLVGMWYTREEKRRHQADAN